MLGMRSPWTSFRDAEPCYTLTPAWGSTKHFERVYNTWEQTEFGWGNIWVEKMWATLVSKPLQGLSFRDWKAL